MKELTPALRCDLVREVRVILVRHFIDIGKVHYTVTNRGLYIAGYLDRLPGAMSPLTPEIVESLFRELDGIPRLGVVFADFENWKQTGGGVGSWVSVERRRSQSAPGDHVKTFEIGENDVLKPPGT